MSIDPQVPISLAVLASALRDDRGTAAVPLFTSAWHVGNAVNFAAQAADFAFLESVQEVMQTSARPERGLSLIWDKDEYLISKHAQECLQRSAEAEVVKMLLDSTPAPKISEGAPPPAGGSGGHTPAPDCPICLDQKADQLKCPTCGAVACGECVLRHFAREDGSEILPGCLSCRASFTFSHIRGARGFTGVRCQIGKVARKRITSQALSRERAILASSEQITAIYRNRRIALACAALIASDLEVQTNRVAIEAHRGAKKVSIRPIRCSLEVVRALKMAAMEAHVAAPARTLTERVLTLRAAFKSEIARLVGCALLNGARILPDDPSHLDDLMALAFAAWHGRGVFSGAPESSRNAKRDLAEIGAKARDALADGVLGAEDAPSVPPLVAMRILKSRRMSVDALASFLSEVPREWWLVQDPSELADLFVTVFIHQKMLYEEKMVRRQMIPRAPSRALEFASGSDIERACLRAPACRGHMYRKPIELDPSINSAHAPSVQDVRAARAARFSAPAEGVAPEPKFVLACQLCGAEACARCHAALPAALPGGAALHVCDPNTVESISEILTSTRPCPQCGERIFRTEGCRHMFCPRCKQAYDWETLEPQIHNTNPEFLAWIRESRQQAMLNGNTSAYAPTAGHEIQTIFSTETLGEDGMTTRERLENIRMLMERAGTRVLANVMLSVENIETKVIQPCVSLLPTPKVFEDMRVAYLLGDISEEEWIATITSLETRSFVFQKLIGMLTEYSARAVKIACDAYESAQAATLQHKSSTEASAFAQILYLASEVSKNSTMLEMITTAKTPIIMGIMREASNLALALHLQVDRDGAVAVTQRVNDFLRDRNDPRNPNSLGASRVCAVLSPTYDIKEIVELI